MLLELYISLMCVVFLLLIIGYWKDDIAIKGIAFIFMALINLPLTVGSIEYAGTDIINKTSSSITKVTHSYAVYDFHYFAFILSILGIVGSTYQVWDEWSNKKAKRIGDWDDD